MSEYFPNPAPVGDQWKFRRIQELKEKNKSDNDEDESD